LPFGRVVAIVKVHLHSGAGGFDGADRTNEQHDADSVAAFLFHILTQTIVLPRFLNLT
jgi:hypothetical protein